MFSGILRLDKNELLNLPYWKVRAIELILNGNADSAHKLLGEIVGEPTPEPTKEVVKNTVFKPEELPPISPIEEGEEEIVAEDEDTTTEDEDYADIPPPTPKSKPKKKAKVKPQAPLTKPQRDLEVTMNEEDLAHIEENVDV